ncbi:MAG: class II fructose-bisphosphate aldolase, partial [Candidatus Marinimicrobia bacterium]|nr:class II fructose-bisphosphate aldolase [Candidatus Neomarinimicrobiota bacterium]MBT7738185.1 class II fructose-bisphosphate aldolase [Candidatus Neomarinimicrobiota bacterium]
PEDGTPYKKQYDPRKVLRDAETSMIERLDEAFADLGSVGASLAN